ncbi:hypothetical protein [uncultured Nisaea sp.]|jgi:hypothetical protein|uniref:hypothetical protein n=1 Tax=uncultured Nisaea sp. TaxID=538215 RepID=UPI0030ECB130|tara:strand:+ start:618 stop:857 length:240 start_codon:yes stop_codon:yes gene_type:complete
MIPAVPVSVPLNATLPTLVAPRPVEQERDRNNRPLTAAAISSTDEGSDIQGDNERATALRNSARRESQRQRGDEIDIFV